MYVENQRPEVERPGSHRKDFALHLSPRPPPFKKNISNPQPFDDRAECRGPRGEHILLREGLVIEKLLERQHPRDLFKSKGRSKLPDHPTILPSQKYIEQA